MNEHLQPVFGVLLPELEGEAIKYWVYGGVGIAAVVREFFRRNNDVDIFVIGEPDYEKARSLLTTVCGQNGFKLIDRRPLNGRPKFEVIDNEKQEILSVVPAYRKDEYVEFIFGRRRAQYGDQMVERTPRNIAGHSLFSPPDECIRELFKTYVTNRRRLRTRREIWNSIRRDAEKILTLDEICELKIPPVREASR